jgi:hypothetical protein
MRPIQAVAFLAAASTLLAGCLSGKGDGEDHEGDSGALPDASTLSQKVFEILPPEEVWVTTSDAVGEGGTRLHNAVFRPDTKEPVPVFINFSPYWGDTAMERGDAFSRYMVEEYVPRGYAVVLSAIRGTGHSEGCFEIGSDRESLDVNEVVDFFASTEWSNGNIAAGGKSYDSTSQNGMVAKFPHEALKGIFHVSGITDMYRYTMHDGVPYGESRTISFTSSYYATQGANEYPVPDRQDPAAYPEALMSEDPESLGRLIEDAACPAAAQHVSDSTASAFAGQKTAYWVERDWTRSIGQSSWNGSIFFVHGLQDWNVQPDHIQPWMDEVLAKGDIEVLAWLHQWTRSHLVGGDGHVYPMRTDWNETMLRWMDHVLKGKDTGLDQLYGFESQATDRLFRRSATWPPVPATTLQLGGLGLSCNATCSTQEVTLMSADAGALRMAGSPVVTVGWQAQTADPVLTAVLYKHNATGRHWVGEATLRGMYRDSLETPSPVVVGESYSATFAFYPLDSTLAPGEEWVLVFGAPTEQGTGRAQDFAAPSIGPVSPPDPRPGDVLYDLSAATLAASILPASDGLLPMQPVEGECFTC